MNETREQKFEKASSVYVITITEVSARPFVRIDEASDRVVVLGRGVVNEILKGVPEFKSVQSTLLRGVYDKPQPSTSCGSGISIAPYDVFIIFEREGEQPIAGICESDATLYRSVDEKNHDLLHRVRKIANSQQ